MYKLILLKYQKYWHTNVWKVWSATQLMALKSVLPEASEPHKFLGGKEWQVQSTRHIRLLRMFNMLQTRQSGLSLSQSQRERCEIKTRKKKGEKKTGTRIRDLVVASGICLKHLPLSCYFLEKVLLCPCNLFQLPHPVESSDENKETYIPADSIWFIFMLVSGNWKFKQCCDWLYWYYLVQFTSLTLAHCWVWLIYCG